MPSSIERRLARGFALIALLLIALAAWQCRNGWPVSADLLELVPAHRADAVQTQAEARMQEPLSRELVALVGAAQPARAVELARQTAQAWRASGLFDSVQVDITVDLPGISRQLQDQRLSLMPESAAHALTTDPAAFARARAAELANPFSSAGVVAMDRDWLGLAHRAEQAQAPGGDVHLDLATGTLQAEYDKKTWVLVHARTRGDAFDQSSPQAIANETANSRRAVRAAGGDMLAVGGALYAAAGRTQAVRESSWIGTAAALGIVLLILLAVRRPRALLAFIPVVFGLLCGIVACVALFGKIHVMTLVVGASLIGVASDFPMHWLGKSYGMPDWRAWPAMWKVIPGLSISLAASLVGYLALAFTPFPALTQTAVFSAAGLLGAYACTVCLLPPIFRNWTPRPWMPLARGAERLLQWRETIARHRLGPWLLALPVAAFAAAGIARLHLHDDIRQWISAPPALTEQARRIGTITGFMPTSQFFLVRAPDETTLLARQAQVARELDRLVGEKRLTAYTALSQLAAPLPAQEARRAAVVALKADPAFLAAFLQLGVPQANIDAEIDHIAHLPAVNIGQALAGPLGERWRPLWLGRQADGSYAGMVSLLGLSDAGALAKIAEAVPGTSLIDRTGELNRAFSSTRVEAAALKALSYVLAAVILGWAFGCRATLRILAVPLAATACSLAMLGLLGQPLTLFSLFGLLLVSAIGVDYAVFMHESVAGSAASLIGILLAAATTFLSFGLLAFSSTPAIANFGLAVGMGVVFSLLFAPWVIPVVSRKS